MSTLPSAAARLGIDSLSGSNSSGCTSSPSPAHRRDRANHRAHRHPARALRRHRHQAVAADHRATASLSPRQPPHPAWAHTHGTWRGSLRPPSPRSAAPTNSAGLSGQPARVGGPDARRSTGSNPPRCGGSCSTSSPASNTSTTPRVRPPTGRRGRQGSTGAKACPGTQGVAPARRKPRAL